MVAVTAGDAPKQTYDLTVEGEPEFFANGLLVHNCIDALRYAIYSDQHMSDAKPEGRRVRTDSGRHGVFLKGRR